MKILGMSENEGRKNPNTCEMVLQRGSLCLGVVTYNKRLLRNGLFDEFIAEARRGVYELTRGEKKFYETSVFVWDLVVTSSVLKKFN
jgi:hypothetical protein